MNLANDHFSRRTRRRRARTARSYARKRVAERGATLGGLAVLLMLCVTFLIRQIQIRELEAYIETLEKQVEYYTQTNEGLRRQIQILQSDEYIERVAREQLGLVKPGEVPYILTEPVPQGADRSSGSEPGGFTRK